MLALLDQSREDISRLCRKYGVRRLEVFGSAARGDFDPAENDLDFLVLFDKKSTLSSFDRFFGLKEDLQKLLGREIDSVDFSAARNPYFIAEALPYREKVYAA